MDESDSQKAQDFLQAQQHYYRELRQHKEDLGRFQASRQEHRDAMGLLADLPKQVFSSTFLPMPLWFAKVRAHTPQSPVQTCAAGPNPVKHGQTTGGSSNSFHCSC